MNNNSHTNQHNTLSISEAAEYLEVSTKTLRRWEKAGLIHPQRNERNQRVYTRDQLTPLQNRKHQPLPSQDEKDLHQVTAPIIDTRASISETASALGVSSKTIRRWDEQGLITSQRNERNHRVFSQEEITRVKRARLDGSFQAEQSRLFAIENNQQVNQTTPTPVVVPPVPTATISSEPTQVRPEKPIHAPAPPPVIQLGTDSDKAPRLRSGAFAFLASIAFFLSVIGTYSILSSQNRSGDSQQLIAAAPAQKGLIGRVLGITTSLGNNLNFNNIIDSNFNFGVAGTLEGSQLIASSQSQAPLIVSSNLRVANLNADLLDGKHLSEIEALISNSGDLQSAYDSGSTINTDTVDIVFNLTNQATDADFKVNLLGSNNFNITGNSGENIALFNPTGTFGVDISKNTRINGSVNLSGPISATSTLTFSDANTSGTIPLSDSGNTGLPSGYNSILDVLADVPSGGGGGLFTDGGSVTYRTDAADDFAIGGTGLSAAFSVDISENSIRVGDGSGSDGDIVFYADDGDTGTLRYSSSDEFRFEGGNIIATQDLTIEGGNLTGSNGENIAIGDTDDIIAFFGSGGADNTDFYIDLDGSAPQIYSNTDSTILVDDDLSFVGPQTLSTTSGNLTITPGNSLVISTLDCTSNANGGTLTADASGVITCADDDGGSLTVSEESSAVTSDTIALNFDGDYFNITDAGSNQADITIDFASSNIVRSDQAETITGGWTFNTASTTFTSALNANGGITTTAGNLVLNSTGGTVDVQDALTADSLTLDTSGIIISANDGDITFSGTGTHTISASSGTLEIGAASLGGTLSMNGNNIYTGTTTLSPAELDILDSGITLGTETAGNYVATLTGGDGISGSASTEGATPTLAIDLLDASDGAGITSSNSGLEFGGAGDDELALIQGCSDNQILKWNDTASTWGCANDISGAGSIGLDDAYDVGTSISVDAGDLTLNLSDATSGGYSLTLDNTSAGTIDVAFEVTSTSTNAITTAIDLSNANIVTALALGSNDITVGGVTLSASEMALLDGGITLGELTNTGLLSASNVDIDGGSIDNVTIGGATPAAGTFTTLTSTGNTVLGNTNTDTLTINAGQSGSGIIFGDASFDSCTALETSNGVLVCGTDNTGSGAASVEENGSEVVASLQVLDFLGNDFIIADGGSGQADISIDYANSNIVRSDQAETITGGWTFNTAATTFTSALNADGGITTSAGNLVLSSTGGSLDINDATIALNSQATDFDVIDNNSNALTISEAAANYLRISTANGAEAIAFGNDTTAPDYTFEGAGSFTIDSLTTDGIVTVSSGVLSSSATVGGNLITDNSLDFDDFANNLTLDASTEISMGSYALSTTGTGALSFNSTGQVTFAGNVDATNGLDVTGGLTVSGEATANSLYVTNNIALGGTVDGRDIAADGAVLDVLDALGLDALTSAEVDQLENIGAITISNTQWGYLGSLDQRLETTSSPTFANLTLTGGLDVTGEGTFGSLDISGNVALGSLTINSETLTNLAGTGLSITNGILNADAGELATLLSTWDQDASDDLTTGNYTGTLDSVYVNIDETPAVGDISGDFSNGFSIVANSVALGTDTTGDYIDNLIGGDGIAISGSAGEGWDPTVAIDLIDSNSGLAFVSGELGLRQDCATDEVLAWNGTGWACKVDSTSSGQGADFAVEENNSEVVSTVSSIDFLGADFDVSLEGTSETNISIDYANSTITRANQDETITGSWSFSSELSAASLNIAGEGTFGSITDGTATLASGDLTGLLSLGVDSLRFDGTTIGLSTDTDLLSLADNALTINGTVNATGGFLLNGTNINTGGTLTNVAYLDQPNTFTDNQTITGNLTVSGVTSSGSLIISGEATADSLYITNNIALGGTVDGRDVAADGVILDALNALGLSDLTIAEIDQLENIDLVTISNTQWGYLGSLDQRLETTSSPTFDTLTLSGNLDVTGEGTFGSITDGTATLASGDLSGLLSLGVDNLRLDGNTLGLATDTDLLSLADDALTVNGTVNATAGFLLNGTNINTGGTLTNVAYLDQQNSFTDNQAITGNLTVSGVTSSGSLVISGEATADSLYITNNIALGGTVDGRDVAADGVILDALNALGLSDLTIAEVDQLENIDLVTISNTQWGYLGSLDQRLETTSSPTFANLNITGEGTFGSITDGTATLTSGDITGLTSAAVDSLRLDDIYIGLSSDADLLSLANDALTVNGTVNATGGFLFNGTDINTGGTLTNVAYLDQANSFTANQTITGDLTVSGQGSFGTLNVSGEATADSLYITNNIALGGTVDGRDIAADGTNLDQLYTTIGLSALDSAEVDQLENIGAVTISNTQWGYLGALDQSLATTDSPTFDSLTLTGGLDVTGEGTFGSLDVSGNVALGSLTINSETLTNLAGTGLSITNGILNADAGELASLLSTWDQDASDDLTTGNYTTTLDSVYVNVGENPAAGDISGSFSGGLTIDAGAVNFAQIADSLLLDADTTIYGSGVNDTLTFNTGTILDINGTLDIGGEAFSTLTGDGLALSGNNLAIDLVDSNSGLALTSGELGLRQDCATDEVLSWNGAGWVCKVDSTSSGQGADFAVEENNSQVVSTVSSLDFLGADFDVALEGTSETNISIDYANSTITRANQDETITGTWSFSNELSAASLNITGEGTFGSITDGTAMLASGDLSGLLSLGVDSLRLDGSNIGLSTDTDLLSFADNALTVNGTVNATGGFLLNGTNINTGGALTNVAYLDQANSFTANQDITGGLTVSGLTSSGSLIISGEATADSLYVTNNITLGGTVDGRDIANDGSNLDNLYTTIGLSALDSAEVDQLENIGAVTINNTQWGYLGALDQSLATTDSPTFDSLTLTGGLDVTGEGTFGSITDGTATLTSGDLTGLTSLAVDSLRLDDIYIGLSSDADLLSLANDALTVNGTVNATGGFLLNGTNINTGGTLTNVAYLDQTNTFSANQAITGGLTVSGQGTFGTVNVTGEGTFGSLVASGNASLGSLTLATETFTNLTGDGLTIANGILQLNSSLAGTGLTYINGVLDVTGLTGSEITADALNFTELADSLVLDADTTIFGSGVNDTLTFNTGTILDVNGTFDLGGEAFSSLTGSGLTLSGSDLAIDTTAGLTWSGATTFTNTVDVQNALTADNLTIDNGDLTFTVGTPNIVIPNGDVLSFTDGSNTLATLTDNGSTATFNANIINATTTLQLGGTDINTTGTLTNVAYKGQDNNFTTSQTITGGLAVSGEGTFASLDVSGDVALSSLTINAETFTNLTGAGLSITNGILNADAGELATLLSTWDQDSSDDLTTGNYSGTLDSVYVNEGQSPTGGEISGSFSGGLTINDDVINFTEIADALILDADTTIAGSGVNDTLTFNTGTVLDINGTFDIAGEAFSSLTGTGLTLSGSDLAIDTTAGLTWSGATTFTNTVDVQNSLTANDLTIDTGDLTFTVATPNIVIPNGDVLSFTDGSNTLATLTDNGSTATFNANILNATSDLQIGGSSINTAGTLSNVAYLNTTNTFTANQTVSGGLNVSGESTFGNNINFSNYSLTLSQSDTSFDSGDTGIIDAINTAYNTASSGVSADSLDFSEFMDTLTLDADTTIVGSGANDTLTFNTGTILDVNGTLDIGGEAFSTLTGTGLTLSGSDLAIDTTAGLTWSGATTFTNTVDVQNSLTANDLTIDTGDLEFTVATPNIVIPDGDVLAVTDGTNTLATITDNGTTGTLNANIINATSTLQIGGTDINTAGTLTNVAYLNAQNTFTANQTISAGLDVSGEGTFASLVASGNVSLGSLTINSETFTNLTGTGLSITNGILNADAGELASLLSTWDQDASDDLTTGNYTGTLDSVYVNVGENPAAGDISGSFSGGLNINNNALDFSELSGTLTLDTDTSIGASGTNNTLAFNSDTILDVDGTFNLGNEAFSSLTGSGLTVSGADLAIDTTAGLTWSGATTFTNTVDVQNSLTANDLTIDTGDLEFTVATPNIVIPDGDVLAVTDGTNTLATITDNGTTGTLNANIINATSTLQIGGTDINTSGTLTNVAYLDTANTFTANQTISAGLNVSGEGTFGSFNVASDAFTINSSGVITNIDGVAHSISDEAGDLTLTSDSGSVDIADSLSVAGNITGTTALYFTGGSGTVEAQAGALNLRADTNNPQIILYGESTEYARFDSTGEFGLGTSAPDAALEINDASGDVLRLTYNDADGSATNYADFSISSSGDLTIAPSGGDLNITGNLASTGEGSFGSLNVTGESTFGGNIAFSNYSLDLSDTDTSFDSGDTGIIDAINTAYNTASAGVSADSLDFTEFADSLTLDADTTIFGSGVNDTLTFNTGTILDINGTLDIGGEAFSTLTGTGLELNSTALRIDEDAALTWTSTQTFSGAIDANSTLSVAGDITFDATTPTIVLNDGEVLSFTDGSNTLATLTDNGTTATFNANIINATSTLQIAGTDINTGGTLSNLAYLDQANTFTANQTISAGLNVSGEGTFGSFNVASDAFTINSSGVITNIDSVAHSISDEAGDLTLTSNSGTTDISGDISVSGGDILGANSAAIDLGEAASGDISTNTDLLVGGTSNTVSGLTLSGDDLFVAGDAGVEGTLYVDTSIQVDSTNATAFLLGDGTNDYFTFDGSTDAGDTLFNVTGASSGITSGNIFSIAGDTITNGSVLDISADSLTSGKALNISSTSTAWASGDLIDFDWSPGSATTSTGNLLTLNVGSNGTLGNIFDVQDGGSSVFSVGQSQITANLPFSFASGGDVSFANDINFTNQTASYITSKAPLYIEAGEVFESNDITLRTYNNGAVIIDNPDSGLSISLEASTGNIVTSGEGSFGSLAIANNTILGESSSDTVTFNAGSSGSGITFADSSFQSCTALETNASGVLTCGTDASGASTLDESYTGGQTINLDTANLVLQTSDDVNDYHLVIDNTSGGTIGVGLSFATTAGDFSTAIDASDVSISTAINIGTGDIVGTTADINLSNFDVVGSSGNITTAGTLAVNGDSITADGATLTINAAGAVDIQDNLTADSLTIDTGDLVFENGETITNDTDGTLAFTDGSNTLVSITDQGTTGNLNVSGEGSFASLVVANGSFAVNTSGIISAIDSVAHSIDDVSGDLTLTSNSGTLDIIGDINLSGGDITGANSAAIDLGEAVSGDIYINTDLLVGGTSETIFSSGFAFSGNDVYLADKLGVAGTIYSNAGVTIDDNTGNLDIDAYGLHAALDLNLISDANVIVRADNDTTDYVYFDTTSNNPAMFFERNTADTNDSGIRLNSTTNQVEYRDEDSATWVALDDLAGGSSAWSGLTAAAADLTLSLGSYTTTFNSTATTGTPFTYNFDSLTTGTALDISAASLSTGAVLSIETSSTNLASGASLGYFEWAPGSADTSDADLFTINVGANGILTGDLFNVQDNGSDLFAVGQSKITSAVPHEFTAAGDVSIGYDIQFTNQTASTIKSDGPLSIESGEVFESQNLSFTTYNSGNFVFNNGGLIISTDQSATANALCHSGADSDTTITDREVVACTNSPGDIAEWYDTGAGVEAGDIVAASANTVTYESEIVDAMTGMVLDQTEQLTATVLEKSTQAYQGNILGIVSTSPVQNIGRAIIEESDNPNPIAITGRVPVKISAGSDPIQPGDPITASTDAGKGMKATQAGQIVGRALEAWTPGSGKTKISVMTNLSWYDPQTYLSDIGTLESRVDNLETDLASTLSQLNALGTQVDSMTDDITANTTAIATVTNQVADLETVIASNSATLATINNSFSTNRLGVGVAAPATNSGRLIDTASGAYLSDGGVWTNVSDVNMKENFANIDVNQILAGINNLDISSWNYIAESDGVRHIGPTAQDFYAAFGFGANNTSISTIDPAGVALAGIKGLSNQIEDIHTQIAADQEKIDNNYNLYNVYKTYIEALPELISSVTELANRVNQVEQLESPLVSVTNVSTQEDTLVVDGNLQVSNNASISGRLDADQLTTDNIVAYDIEATNATFGDLIADSIKAATISADTIDGLDEKVDTAVKGRLALLEERMKAFEAQQDTRHNSQETNNGQIATEQDSIVTIQNDSNQTSDQLTNQPINQSATSSANLADISTILPDTTIDFDTDSDFDFDVDGDISPTAFDEVDGFFVNEFLAVNGTASIVQAEITDYATVGGNLLVTHNSLSTLGNCDSLTHQPINSSTTCDSTLFLQPTGGSLNLLAGLMTLDETGGVTINGDLTVTGLAKLNQVDTNRLTFGNILGETDEATNSSTLTSGQQLTTNNQSASIALTDKSDLRVNLASGSALVIGQNGVNEVTSEPDNESSLTQQPINSATASARIASDGSAEFETLKIKANSGSAQIAAGSQGVIIEPNKLSASSQVIVTFEGDFAPATRYWITKDLETGRFTIHLDNRVGRDVSAFWLIIN